MAVCGADIGVGAVRSNIASKPRCSFTVGKSHVGGVRKGYGRPPLLEYSRFLFSSRAAFIRRLTGLNCPSRSNGCTVGRLLSKKLLN
jgi:hypothetical protein